MHDLFFWGRPAQQAEGAETPDCSYEKPGLLWPRYRLQATAWVFQLARHRLRVQDLQLSRGPHDLGLEGGQPRVIVLGGGHNGRLHRGRLFF